MSTEGTEEHFFYDKPIFRHREQTYIESLLAPLAHEAADDALKKKIWDMLQNEKALGRLSIPFKVTLRRDAYGKFPPYIEIILDTKL